MGGRVVSVPAARLRLAHSVPTAPVVVATDPTDLPASGDGVLLLEPLPARAAAVARMRAGRGTLCVSMALPGIGARYLVGVARAAALAGWGAGELAALTIELERRCTYIVAAAGVAPLVGRSLRLQRRDAARYAADGWSRVPASRLVLADEARAALARGNTCAAAIAGTSHPRFARRAAADLAGLGMPVGRAPAALPVALGSAWTVELLAAPALGTPQLQTLRDRFSTASRCDWCGLPVVGRHCRRCTPGDAS
jgi:hypothetical protein